jgi:hypothetical protein
MKVILPFIVILFIGICCSETAVDPTLKVSITTESTSTIYDTWAMLNIKNGASRNVYLAHTSDRIGFWKLEKAFKDSWIDVSRDTSFCRWLPTFQKVKLAPDETYHDSVLVLRVGKYRINFPFGWDEYESEIMEIPPTEFDVE